MEINEENSDSVEETIGGIKFVVTRFSSQEAFKLQFYLAKLFGPTLGRIIGAIADVLSGKSKLGDLNLNGEELELAVLGLLNRLGGEDEYLAFIQRMLKKTQAYVNGQMKPFSKDYFNASLDAVFGGRTLSIVKVIALVLRANYPDFLSEIKGFTGGLIQKTSISGQGEENTKKESIESGTSDD